MEIIAQCTRCNRKVAIDQHPTESMYCSECKGFMSVYTSSVLSPEELAAYGPAAKNGVRPSGVVYKPSVKMRNTDQNGEQIKPPVVIKPKKREENEDVVKVDEKDGTPVKKFIPNKVDVLKGIVAGKSLGKLEKQWGMPTSTLSYHMGKWGWKGLKADRAQQILDEMAIDEGVRAAATAGGMPVPIAVEAPVAVNVEKLQQKLSDAIGERNQFRDLYGEVENENTQLKEAMEGAAVIANHSGERIRELEDERQLLLQQIECAVDEQSVVQVVALTSKRQIRIETSGSQNLIEDELLAMLNYVQAMRGRDLVLELYLGEVAG